MNWIDTHAHIDLSRFGDDAERRAAVQRAQAAGIVAVVIPGIEPTGWDGLLACAAQLRDFAPSVGFLTAVGLHPQALPGLAPEHDDRHCEELARWVHAAPTGMVAIGECGLDFSAEVEAGAPRARQIAVLMAHFALARRTGFPLLLHCLHAHAVLLELLRAAAPLPPSILHSWSGSAELATLFCRAGHFISFAGSVTQPRARRPLESARAVPADRLLLETDSPDQTPHARRPARNEPAFLLEVAAAVAAARGEALPDLAIQTTANARRVLRLA